MVERAEHEDWHFAKDLQTQERGIVSGVEVSSRESPGSPHSTVESKTGFPPPKKPSVNASNSGPRLGKMEKGQRRLAFGR